MSRRTSLIVLVLAACVPVSLVQAGAGSLVATFVADLPTPSSDTVAMVQGFAEGDLVTVDVVVTDVAGVFAGAFDVGFDPASAAFIGHAPGTLLESDGQPVVYQVSEVDPGRLVVGASRLGPIPGVDAVGTQPLIRLTFRVLQAGESLVEFLEPVLLDASVAAIPGLTWFGGRLIGESGCPATVATRGEADAGATLATLYRFRDEILSRTEKGREYRRLYYAHAEEGLRLLLRDPDLRAKGLSLLDRLLPAVRAANRGRVEILSLEDIAAIDDLLDAVASRASPALRRDVEALRGDVNGVVFSGLLAATPRPGSD